MISVLFNVFGIHELNVDGKVFAMSRQFIIIIIRYLLNMDSKNFHSFARDEFLLPDVSLRSPV